MSAELVLRNVGLYSLQVVILTAVAGLLPWALRLRAPKPLLTFWYAVLAICVLLPVVQPWAQPPVQTSGGVTYTSIAMLPADSGSKGGILASWPGWPAATLIVIFAGVTLRFALLGLGLVRLNRLRRRAEPVDDVPSIVQAVRSAGIVAGFRCSAEISGPVTFGFRNPTVLVPPGFFDLGEMEQQSVAIHELLHVGRRDWMYTLAEECVRAVLWFHPAIWFLLNRVQLAREQAVDESVVRHTRASGEYVGALLKIAAARIEPDLAPAPLFLKKRHLRQRVAAIMEGVSMSKRRLIVTMIAVLAMLPVVAGLLAWQIPLQAAPQEVRDAEGVQVNTGYFKVLHRTGVEYPAELRDKAVTGDVVVAVTVNPQGDVTDAKVVSGRAELRKPVLESVLNWHFSMDPVDVGGTQRPVPSSFEVGVRFQAPASVATGAPPKPPQEHRAMLVDKIDTSRLPAELRDRVNAALSGTSGETVSPEKFAELTRRLEAIDRHLRMRGSIKNNETAMDLQVTVQDQPMAASQPPLSPQRIRVGGNAQALNLIQKVTPKYPAEAKAAGIQGAVKLQAVIGKDGTVQNLELISGPPELVENAMEAVRQWVYRPTLLNGNPVEVLTQIDVNYTLAK